MKKKIFFIILGIAIIAVIFTAYTSWAKRKNFKPTSTYSICIWGDTTAMVTIKYVAKSGDTNTLIEEKEVAMIRKKSEHALQKWNMIALKPTYFVNAKNVPLTIDISTQNKSKVYVAIFNNDTMPRWQQDSFLVFHLLMLRSAYDNNPDVAAKSLEEWIEKSPSLKDKNDSSKNIIAQALWQKMQLVDRDSIARYLQTIHYPLFKMIEKSGETSLLIQP